MRVQNMKVAPALRILEFKEQKALQDGRNQVADQISRQRRLLNGARGETLWDVYQAQERRIDSIQSWDSYRVPRSEGVVLGRLLLSTAAVGAAILASNGSYLGAGLGTAATLVGGLTLISKLSSKNVLRASTPIFESVAAGVVTGFLTENLWKGVGVGLSSLVVQGGMSLYLASKVYKASEIQSLIQEHAADFEKGAKSELGLGQKIQKDWVISTIDRLQAAALDRNDFRKATDIGKEKECLQQLAGQTFAEMLTEARGRGDKTALGVLQNRAAEIIKDAAANQEVKALMNGVSQAEATEILMGENHIVVGGHALEIAH